jgi:hypothetical protein
MWQGAAAACTTKTVPRIPYPDPASMPDELKGSCHIVIEAFLSTIGGDAVNVSCRGEAPGSIHVKGEAVHEDR